ncbi:MAG: response regulator [Methyloprofundus sp.]|nr:response regulator [Methyloprofundus sp.]
MFFKEWVVLLVDDEPDVLSMSKLIMKNFEVYGLPLKIYTAESKAEAIQLFNSNLDLANSLSVAFIDVVMETDTAGLELCEYIRNDMGNRLTQLYIRTGQPGITTETEVIDKYDINGYFTKIEATPNKLYSLIKSSVRQYLSYGMSLTTAEILKDLTCAATAVTGYFPESSLNSISGSQRAILGAVHRLSGYSIELKDIPRWLFIDGEVLFREEVDAELGNAMRKKMLFLKGIALSPNGDKYITDEDNFHLILVAETSTQAETIYLFQTKFEPPEHVIDLLYSVVISLAVTWKQSS